MPVAMASHSSWTRWLILPILFLAAAFRLYGIGFGLPDLYHADEPIVVHHALACGSGDFHPHFFKIPPLLSYLLFTLYGASYLVLKVSGTVSSPDHFATIFLADPTGFYWLGRLVFGAGTGVLTVFALYMLIRTHFSRKQALISSFFLAVCFLHVRDSHYIYPDIPLGLLLVLCFFPIFNLVDRPGRRPYAWFGLAWGTSTAMKYNGVFVLIPFLAAHFFGLLRRGWKQSWGHGLMAAGLALGTFGILNPFAWLDVPFFWKELLGQSRSEGFSGFFHHLGYGLTGGIGVPLLLCSALGMWRVLSGRDWKQKVMLSFVVGYYVVLVLFSQPYERYVLPLIPFLLFFAAIFLVEAGDRFRLSPALLAACVFLAASPTMIKAYYSDGLFAQEDIRTVARQWVEEHLPSGAKVVLDNPFFLPKLRPTSEQLQEKISMARAEGQAARHEVRLTLMLRQAKEEKRPRYELYFLSEGGRTSDFLFSRPNVPYRLDVLEKMGIQYVLFAKLGPDYQNAFYQELRGQAKLVGEFNPYRDVSRKWPIDDRPLTGGPFLWRELVGRQRNGQIIELYQLLS